MYIVYTNLHWIEGVPKYDFVFQVLFLFAKPWRQGVWHRVHETWRKSNVIKCKNKNDNLNCLDSHVKTLYEGYSIKSSGSHWKSHIIIYNYIVIILINNSWRKDKGNQWHDGGCISGYKILLIYIDFNFDKLLC